MKFKKALSNTERLESITQLISNNKHITVDLICQEFDVSASTARRDLELLSQQGVIQRVHGGALALQKTLVESPVIYRMDAQAENKRAIAEAAAALVNPGESIFLGSGTTVLEVAKQIRDIENLTVITNSLLIINELINNQNIYLVDLGGIIRRSELSMIGSITENALSGLFANKVIIGIYGIDLEQGLTNQYLPETMTDRKILQMSKNIIIVADHTKFGRVSTTQVASLSTINTIVTDKEAPQEMVEEIKTLGVNVIQA